MKSILKASFLALLLFAATQADAQYYGLVGSAGTPTVSACGTSPSLVISSQDHAGTIIVGSGILVTSCTLNFSTTLVGTTRCVIFPYGLAVSPLVSAITTSSSGFTVDFVSTVAGAKIDYSCFIN